MKLAYVTMPDEASAETLSKSLLNAKLAACTNLIPGMTSHYHWEGKIETSKEFILIAKTKAKLVDQLIAHIEENHPYETPCVMILDVEAVAKGYKKWLLESLK